MSTPKPWIAKRRPEQLLTGSSLTFNRGNSEIAEAEILGIINIINASFKKRGVFSARIKESSGTSTVQRVLCNDFEW